MTSSSSQTVRTDDFKLENGHRTLNLPSSSILHSPQALIQQPSFNFDFISTMASTAATFDNQQLRPKILKMLDTVQTSLDLNNEKLIEQIGKQREHELIELNKKTSDLSHRQKLQAMLIESINANDFRKASFINQYLNDFNLSHIEPTTHVVDNEQNGTTSSMLLDDQNYNETNDDDTDYNLNDYEQSPSKTNDFSQQETKVNQFIDYEEDSETMITNNRATNSQQQTSEFINLNDSIRDAFTKAKKSNPLSPIRHLICSPGLEAKAQNCKIIILYRGRCNGICYQNKPWSKELHIHYIINTVNCNDHVSRLVKKQGIQFYNSFVLQNQERIKQLIQMYKMEKV